MLKQLVAATAIGALLLCGAGCGGARSLTEAAPVRELPEPLVDASIKSLIEAHGGALAEAGKPARTEDLEKQLDRERCELVLPPARTLAMDLPALYKSSVPGTLIVSRIYFCDTCQRWHSRADATAIALTADGACVTNYHVFAHSDPETVMVVTNAWGEAYPVVEVLAASHRDDAAIFRVDIGDRPLSPLPLRMGLETGSTVAVLSNPGGHFYSFSPGHVSRRSFQYSGMTGDMKELGAPRPHGEDAAPIRTDRLTRVLEITADYGVGSSGGPVLDDRGNVVGMVSNTVPLYVDPKEKKSLQMNFHRCVPAESIQALTHK